MVYTYGQKVVYTGFRVLHSLPYDLPIMQKVALPTSMLPGNMVDMLRNFIPSILMNDDCSSESIYP